MNFDEQLEKDAERLIGGFRKDIAKAAEEVLGRLYVDYVPHIKSDAWMNYRNEMREALSSEYSKREFLSGEEIWARDFRRKILKENKEELLVGLNKDLLKEIEDLKRTIGFLQESSRF